VIERIRMPPWMILVSQSARGSRIGLLLKNKKTEKNCAARL
jgi:hypothetical protein